MLDSMACGCTVLGSATAPVQEVIQHGKNGLLADFFDVDKLAATAVEVLKDPAAYRHLGRAAERTIAEKYSLKFMLPQITKFYEQVTAQQP
jgi:glycosyltransferase involved in cell wall biosynthesis